MQYPQFDPASAITPLTGEELQGLDRLLQALEKRPETEAVMTLDGFDGYLTALAIGPARLRALPTADWLPAIWGGDPLGPDEAAPFGSKRQRKQTVVLVLRHLRHLSQVLAHETDSWEPVFSIAEQGADEWTDARDWCAGFLQAVDLLPEAWAGVFAADSPLAASLQPLLLLGGGLEGVDLPDWQAGDENGVDTSELATCDRLSRAVPDAVLLLMKQISG